MPLVAILLLVTPPTDLSLADLVELHKSALGSVRSLECEISSEGNLLELVQGKIQATYREDESHLCTTEAVSAPPASYSIHISKGTFYRIERTARDGFYNSVADIEKPQHLLGIRCYFRIIALQKFYSQGVKLVDLESLSKSHPDGQVTKDSSGYLIKLRDGNLDWHIHLNQAYNYLIDECTTVPVGSDRRGIRKVEEWKEWGKGVFVPAKVTFEQFSGQTRFRNSLVQIRYKRINSTIPERDFAPSFPYNSRLVDLRNGTCYHVDQTGNNIGPCKTSSGSLITIGRNHTDNTIVAVESVSSSGSSMLTQAILAGVPIIVFLTLAWLILKVGRHP